MGHERLGLLPKTRRWREVVQHVANLSTSDAEISEIAERTLRNVRSRFRRIADDEGVKAAFRFLVALAVASRSPEPQAQLQANGINVPEEPTPLSFARALRTWTDAEQQSPEYRQLAESAAVDAIATWHERHKTQQQRLFEPSGEAFEVWRRAGTGAGFCELSRLFFARLTERYLNYFLEREASSALGNVDERDRFSRHLQEHIDDVSQHAFETARITQSFAAGWFNKHAAEGGPSEREIWSFLVLAFEKLTEELLREGRTDD